MSTPIRSPRSYRCRPILSLFAALALVPISVFATEAGRVEIGPAQVAWPDLLDHGGASLVLDGPGGVFERRFAAGESLALGTEISEGQPLSDGLYTWELRLAPLLVEGPRQRGEGRPVADPGTVGRRVFSGRLTVEGGLFVEPRREASAPVSSATAGSGTAADKTQVILDDLVVIGNACTGLACLSSESFGTDVLRLKDVNNRLHFWDTSGSPFPTNDWRITINSDVSGGASFFAIDDVDGGATPFTIEAGADANALYVDDQGRLGLGTAAPVEDIHLAVGDTPTLRLEQDNSLGFTPQTWDISGNEANFFVEDVTAGNTLPLRIRPGAPSDALYIAADGKLGLGTSNPGAAFHLRRTDGSANLLVQEASTTVATRSLFEIRNAGATQFTINNTNAGTVWRMANNGRFTLSADGTGAFEFDLQTSGDLEIRGTLTESSDVAAKKNFAAVDPLDVLARVEELPVTTWSYRDNPDTVRHIGPMAQDFYAAFGLGGTPTGISPRNLAAVALVSVQGLVREKDAEIAELRQANQALADRLDRLETMLEQLAAQD